MPQKNFPSWLVTLRSRGLPPKDGRSELRSDEATYWVCIGFVLGVLIHNAWPLVVFPWWVGGGLVFGAGMMWWFGFDARHTESARNTGHAGGVPLRAVILIVCVGMGMLRFDATLPSSTDALYTHLGESVAMKVMVEDLGKYDAILRIWEIDGLAAYSRSKLSVTSAGKGMKIGEMWSVSCRIEKNEKTERKQVLYDARKGVFFRCRGTISARRVSAPSPWNLSAMLSTWRGWMTQRIDRLIPGDEGALLAGILYGERGLSSEESAAFRMAGMTHLIAVSGSNISIVVAMLVPLFLALGYHRRTAILFSGIGILLFSIFVGAGASVVRAALMGWLAILARVFGRRASAHYLLLIVGTILIVFDPWALGFDAGFALSFLATWGLLVPGQIIMKKLTWIPEIGGLREAFSTTLAASLATAPYQLWAFGSVSLLGLVTNLVAIPLTAFTMAWGAIACVIGDAIPALVYPAKGMLSAMLLIAAFAERFPMLVITYRLSLPLFMLLMLFFLCLFSNKIVFYESYPQIKRLKSVFESFFG